MKQILLMIAVVALVGCGTTLWVSDPSDPNSVKIEAEIRRAAKKPTGELTKADLEKVTKLNLGGNKLTDVKGLEKLTQLKELYLAKNQLTNVKGLEKLWQLTRLHIHSNQLTSVKGLEKLTQLRSLSLRNNPELTKAQIAELQKALPKCRIYHNAKK